MQSVPEDYPITGLCIVADPTKCPPGYHVILRSHDRQDDCDLWKDSFFRSKVTRYLCFTRQFPLDNGKLNNVLADIVINNERDTPPPGYSLIDYTIDSKEKTIKKRQVCVQMLPRTTTRDAISEIILLSKTRRAPGGYTLVGEINGLMMCFKMTNVPPETPNGVIETNTIQRAAAPPTLPPMSHSTSFDNRPAGYGAWVPIAPPRHKHQVLPSVAPPSYEEAPLVSRPSSMLALSQSPSYPIDQSYHFNREDRNTLRKQDSLIQPSSCLLGVPFQLSGHFQSANVSRNMVPDFHYRSFVDIDNEYNYPFRIEQTALQDS